MAPRPKASAYKAAAFIAGVIYIGVCCWQYTVFVRERSEIRPKIKKTEDRLRRAQLAEREADKFAKKIRDTEEKFSKLCLRLPLELGVDNFVDQLTKLANTSNVRVQDINVRTIPRNFYRLADIKVKLYGNSKAIESLLQDIASGDRLTLCQVLGRGERVTNVIFTIFAYMQGERKQVANDIIQCSEFANRVWLWPFSRRITKMSEQLERLCEEQKQHAERIALLEALKKKQRENRNMETIIGVLEKSENLMTKSKYANR